MGSSVCEGPSHTADLPRRKAALTCCFLIKPAFACRVFKQNTQALLLSLPHRLVHILLLQNKERLLLFSLVRDQSLAIELILNSRKRPIRRAEVHQDPRTHSPQLRNPVEHSELMTIDIRLVL